MAKTRKYSRSAHFAAAIFDETGLLQRGGNDGHTRTPHPQHLRQEFLGQRGDVVEGNSADEAIRIFKARKDIRIVFTDIEMPGSMDGLKLAPRHSWSLATN